MLHNCKGRFIAKQLHPTREYISVSLNDDSSLFHFTTQFFYKFTTQHRGVYIKKLFVRVCVCASGGIFFFFFFPPLRLSVKLRASTR
jgi:hypothetical protein